MCGGESIAVDRGMRKSNVFCFLLAAAVGAGAAAHATPACEGVEVLYLSEPIVTIDGVATPVVRATQAGGPSFRPSPGSPKVSGSGFMTGIDADSGELRGIPVEVMQ